MAEATKIQCIHRAIDALIELQAAGHNTPRVVDVLSQLDLLLGDLQDEPNVCGIAAMLDAPEETLLIGPGGDVCLGTVVPKGFRLATASEVAQQLADAIRERDTAQAENERLRQRLLTAAGDDLCRLSQEEIKAYTSGAVKIPPAEEFLASCKRFHAQIAQESGVMENCLTLAQLIAENETALRERDEALAELARLEPLTVLQDETIAAQQQALDEAREAARWLWKNLRAYGGFVPFDDGKERWPWLRESEAAK